MNSFTQIFQPVIRKINTRSYVKFSFYRDINVFSKKYYDNDTLSKYALKHSINYYEDNNQKKLYSKKVKGERTPIEYDEEDDEYYTNQSEKLARKN